MRKTQIENLQFLKLGGSLITDKQQPHTVRPDLLNRLAQEIALACQQNPSLKLVIGHGSGSFGHVPARRYGTRQGVHTEQEWQGFVEVWQEANALNRIVIDALAAVNLPGLAFSPLSTVTTHNGRIVSWDIKPIEAALNQDLIPVIQGDTVFDTVLGGTIVSTEDLFVHLAKEILPKRILLAGREPGVWDDYPTCTHIIPVITPTTFSKDQREVEGSAAIDVTGGMRSKVQEMLSVVQSLPWLDVFIFSGEKPGTLTETLLGTSHGTCIRYN